MKSTTYVQFLKGALLIVFSTVITIFVLKNGITEEPGKRFAVLDAEVSGSKVISIAGQGNDVLSQTKVGDSIFVKTKLNGYERWFKLNQDTGKLEEALSKTESKNGEVLYNGAPKSERQFFQVGHASKIVFDGKQVKEVKNLGPFSFLSTIESSTITLFPKVTIDDGGKKVTIWYQKATPGNELMRPGQKFKVDKGSTPLSKLNFISLMIALFFGTSALPHVLIRYYTVPSAKDARKSTILAICAIGFFYILTLYMGFGAMVNGVIDVESSNMAAPLLARQIGIILFAIVSAIAFATVLGTVSGLIVAASGAVAHDLVANFLGIELTDKKKVIFGKIAAVTVGILAIFLGIAFKGMNVSFLVGWAFAIAASANFPAIIMLLFWKKTTAKGIAASVGTGMVSALTIILLSPSMFERYGMSAKDAIIKLDNPGIVSIPLSFAALIIVSLITQKKK